MSLKFCSFASGSSGNCYLIKSDTAAILIDAGISGKKIFSYLEETDTPDHMVEAVLITHEHTDHTKSLPVVTKKLPNIFAYANEATWNCITRPVNEDKRRTFITGEDFNISDITVRSFPVPHDAAEPVGFSFYCGGSQVSIVTDVGHITDSIYNEIIDADILVLEANHEKEILLMGNYPYDLKMRILSETGHLSNVSAGECLCQIIGANSKKRRILLGHLSHENNDPSVAMLAVRNTLLEKDIITGEDIQVDVVTRDCCSCIYEA